jgi:PAS domain S-box-containing protein
MSIKPTYEELEQKLKDLAEETDELRQVEKELQESEERFRIMVENANDGIAIIQDGSVKYANPKVVECSGFTPDRFASMSFLDFVHPDDRATAMDRYNRRMKGEPVSDSIVYKMINRDGKLYWDYVNLVEIVWDGKPAFMVLMTDITELKKSGEALKEAHDNLEQRVKERTADLEKVNELLSQEIEARKSVKSALRESEEDLKTSHETFETVLDHLDGIVHASDLQTYEVLFVNKYAKDIFGDVVGKLCWQTVYQDQAGPCSFCKNDKLLNDDGSPTGVHVWETYSTLINRWYEVRACALQWVDGRMVRLSIATDITRRRQTEETLKTKENELEKKTNNLEEVNTALKVLLKRREKDKIELEEKVLLNVRELVKPYMRKLMDSGLNEHQETYASIMESNLKDVISPFMHRLSSKYINLTPSEIQIANLIKQGRSTKEIAKLLNLSARTIKFHRENIRKKIGINNSKANLRTHLISFQ